MAVDCGPERWSQLMEASLKLRLYAQALQPPTPHSHLPMQSKAPTPKNIEHQRSDRCSLFTCGETEAQRVKAFGQECSVKCEGCPSDSGLGASHLATYSCTFTGSELHPPWYGARCTSTQIYALLSPISQDLGLRLMSSPTLTPWTICRRCVAWGMRGSSYLNEATDTVPLHDSCSPFF